MINKKISFCLLASDCSQVAKCHTNFWHSPLSNLWKISYVHPKWHHPINHYKSGWKTWLQRSSCICLSWLNFNCIFACFKQLKDTWKPLFPLNNEMLSLSPAGMLWSLQRLLKAKIRKQRHTFLKSRLLLFLNNCPPFIWRGVFPGVRGGVDCSFGSLVVLATIFF